MTPDFLDRHSRLDSPVHRLPAGLKMTLALVIVVTTGLARREAWLFNAGIACVLMSVAITSRIPALFLMRRLLLLEPIVLGVALLSLFQPGGGRIFLGILVKSTLCLLTMILLANTTPFAKMLTVLRQARCPSILITTLALMYRYLFLLADEASRMKRARQSRTFVLRRRHVWKGLATVVAQLFVRSTERAERIYAAMCARGWR